MRIFLDHTSHILQAYHIARRVAVHNLLLHVVQRIERLLHMHRQYILRGLYASARGHESLGKQLAGNQLLVQSIMRETFRIQVDGNLFSPFSTHSESSHTADATQTVLQFIHIVGQFPIRLVLAFHGNQQCRCIAKIIHHLYGKHIRRKLRLEGGYSMLELAPELILVVQFVIQLHLHKDNPVARGREGLLLLYFLV